MPTLKDEQNTALANYLCSRFGQKTLWPDLGKIVSAARAMERSRAAEELKSGR